MNRNCFVLLNIFIKSCHHNFGLKKIQYKKQRMSDRKEKRSKSEGGIPPGNLGQFPNENNRSIPDIAANVPLMESARDGQVRKERKS